jgi:hypothetical protein
LKKKISEKDTFNEIRDMIENGFDMYFLEGVEVGSKKRH